MSKAKFDFLNFEESNRLLAACEADIETYALLVVALNTGLRLGELLALEWDDIDFHSKTLLVSRSNWCGHISSTKSERNRLIPLNSKVISALKAYRHLKGSYVWCQKNGTCYNRDNIRTLLRRARRKAGLRHFEFHTLRHSFASHLTMLGEPIKAVQELLGHGGIEITLRYAHLSPNVKRDAVESLVLGAISRHNSGTIVVNGGKRAG